MLKELFEKKQEYLNHFFLHLDLVKTEKILNALLECQGKIFFTGVGKSGHVAKKIAVTMTSTGSHALYLCPTDAMHGDIGIITNKDIVVMLSKSGESDELLNLVPHLRNKGSQLISIVSNPASRLVQASHLSISLPLAKELCPFDLAPTTSTSIQMIFGDVLSVAMMRIKKFTIEQYALNHPAGRIGKRITMKVKDLMLKDQQVPCCKPQDKLVETLVELSNKRCGCVLVVNPHNQLLGIFTDGDLRRALQNLGPVALETSIENMMIKSPKWIGPDVLAFEAMKKMEANPLHEITVLPVLDNDNTVLGIIKLHDIIQSGL